MRNQKALTIDTILIVNIHGKCGIHIVSGKVLKLSKTRGTGNGSINKKKRRCLSISLKVL